MKKHWFVTLLILGLITISSVLWYGYRELKNIKPARAVVTPVQSSQEVRPPQQIIAVQKAQTPSIAFVHKGEGVEHVIIRQLMVDPRTFGFEGDTTETRVVKAWAGRKAHLLAIRAGYVDGKFGAEVRVKHSDKVAYVLQTDGQVMQYADDGKSIQASPRNQNLSAGAGTMHVAFLGTPGMSHLSPQEYLYTGEG